MIKMFDKRASNNEAKFSNWHTQAYFGNHTSLLLVYFEIKSLILDLFALWVQDIAQIYLGQIYRVTPVCKLNALHHSFAALPALGFHPVDFHGAAFAATTLAATATATATAFLLSGHSTPDVFGLLAFRHRIKNLPRTDRQDEAVELSVSGRA